MLVVIHWLARNVNLDEGVSLTFFGVTLSASKSEEENINNEEAPLEKCGGLDKSYQA